MNVIRGSGGQKHNRPFQIGGLAPSPRRDALQHLPLAHRVVLHAGRQWRVKVAWRDGVHVHAARGPLVGEGFRDLCDAAFTGRVRWNRDPTGETERGGDGDDFTVSPREHVAPGQLTEFKHRGEIHLQRAIPLVERKVFGCVPRSYTMTGDQNIQPAQSLDRFGKHAAQRVAVGKVGEQSDGSDFGSDGLRAVRRPRNRYRRACLNQPLSQRAPTRRCRPSRGLSGQRDRIEKARQFSIADGVTHVMLSKAKHLWANLRDSPLRSE